MRCQCVICTDYFEAGSDIASVPCGHTFHTACLDRWLKSKPTCPTCRIRVKVREVRKLFLMSLDDTMTDSGRIENELSDANARIHELRQQVATLEDTSTQLKNLFTAKEAEVTKYKQKYFTSSEEVKSLKAKASSFKTQLLENQHLHQTITKLKATIEKTTHMKAVLNGTTQQVEELLTTFGPGESSVRQIATFCVLIKRELTSAKSELRALRNDVSKANRQLSAKEAEVAEQSRKLEVALTDAAKFKEQCTKLANELENLPERGHRASGSKRMSGEHPAEAGGDYVKKKTKLDSSLDITVVPSPPVLTQRTGFLADRNPADPKKLFPPALLGYSKMKIVSGVKKPAPKTYDDMNDDLLLKMMMKKSVSQDERDSKVRTGYNGLGGHSNHIQNKKASIW